MFAKYIAITKLIKCSSFPFGKKKSLDLKKFDCYHLEILVCQTLIRLRVVEVGAWMITHIRLRLFSRGGGESLNSDVVTERGKSSKI